MDKRTKHQQRPPDELVSQYRDIGIPAVAAATRYQSRDRAGTPPRRQDEQAQEDAPAQKDKNENAAARRR